MDPDREPEWSVSLAGCGFRSLYLVGALSCLLERAPGLLHGASRVCGASSGCLVAAAVVLGIPLDQLCADILAVAMEARSHSLGIIHPTFSLLRSLRRSLRLTLPADAHLRASGRLCVSLTRIRDRKNILVSDFTSREELIQVLMCSCFFPVYCGYIPPSYRGELYMDGALSNNMPMVERRSTVTVAPFSGESDICPQEGTFNFFEVNYGNVSIQVNTGNVHRVCSSFLPPSLEKLSEICDNGYVDALRFLTDRGLLVPPSTPPPVLAARRSSCCEQVAPEVEVLNGADRHPWLPRRTIRNLPADLRTVLCAACRGSHECRGRWPGLDDFLLVKVFLVLLIPLALVLDFIVELLLFITHREHLRSESQLKTPVDACKRKAKLQFSAASDSSIRPNRRTSETGRCRL